MINKERVQLAINVMERAGKVDMDAWQSDILYHRAEAKTTEEEIHACGSAACFAGWLAVSSEFHSNGGTSCPKNGAPMFNGYRAASAVVAWMEATDLHDELIRLLILGGVDSVTPEAEGWYTELGYEMEYDFESDELYIVSWDEGKWTAEDVIKVLNALMEPESDD